MCDRRPGHTEEGLGLQAVCPLRGSRVVYWDFYDRDPTDGRGVDPTMSSFPCKFRLDEKCCVSGSFPTSISAVTKKIIHCIGLVWSTKKIHGNFVRGCLISTIVFCVPNMDQTFEIVSTIRVEFPSHN